MRRRSADSSVVDQDGAAPAAPLRFRSPVDQRGFTQLVNCVLFDVAISDAALRTYMVLLDYARQNDAAFPGQIRLAADRGCNDRSIRNHLTELEKRGLITIEQRGLNRTNLYWIESPHEIYAGGSSQFMLDRQNIATPDRQLIAGQARNIIAGHNRQLIATKEDADLPKHRIKKTTAEPEQDNSAAVDFMNVDLVQRLIDAGVNRADALRLADALPAECALQLEYLPYAEVKSTPGAYLRAAIEQGFTAPKRWRDAQSEQEKASRLKQTRANGAQREQTESKIAAARRSALDKLKNDEPKTYYQLLDVAVESLPPPIRNRPDGPAYVPALEGAIWRALNGLSSHNRGLWEPKNGGGESR